MTLTRSPRVTCPMIVASRRDVAGGGDDRDEVTELINGHFVQTSSVLLTAQLHHLWHVVLVLPMRLISPGKCHLCACQTSLGRIAHRGGPPFATLPSTPKLAANKVSRSLGGNMSEVDGATLIARSLKQQGIDHMFGVVGFPVSRDRRGRAEGRHQLHRHAQRAVRLLRRRGRRLSDRPARRLPRRDRPRRGARPRRPRQRAAELLADDPDRRRLGDLSQRHGRVPGRAPGADRHAVLQVRARHRERARASRSMSRWRPGTRSTAAPAPPISTCPTTSSRASASSTRSPQVRARARAAAHAWRRRRTSRRR